MKEPTLQEVVELLHLSPLVGEGGLWAGHRPPCGLYHPFFADAHYIFLHASAEDR